MAELKNKERLTSVIRTVSAQSLPINNTANNTNNNKNSLLKTTPYERQVYLLKNDLIVQKVEKYVFIFFSFFLSLYFFLFFFLFLFFYFFFLSFFHIFCRQTKIVCRLLVICCLKRFVWFCWMTLFLFFFIYKERFCKF